MDDASGCTTFGCTGATTSSGRATRSSAVKSLRCGVERLECGVESPLAAPVGLMVSLSRHEPDQLVEVVVGGSQDSAVIVGADPEHQSLAVGVQQPQLAQRHGHLIRDDDLVDRAHESQPSATQIERRVLPVADDSLVAADAALPPDRCTRRCRRHDHPTPAAPVGWPA